MPSAADLSCSGKHGKAHLTKQAKCYTIIKMRFDAKINKGGTYNGYFNDHFRVLQ